MTFNDIAVWNGIIFNAIGIWAVSGFKRPLEQMAAELTEITMHLYDAEVAADFDPHMESSRRHNI